MTDLEEVIEKLKSWATGDYRYLRPDEAKTLIDEFDRLNNLVNELLTHEPPEDMRDIAAQMEQKLWVRIIELEAQNRQLKITFLGAED